MKLILYLSFGYPSLERSREIATQYVNSGCDVIEVDFPAKDPYMDSEHIRKRMKGALQNEDDYDVYMAMIKTIKSDHPDASFIVLIYENTVLEIGEDKFVSFCKEQGLTDIICVGNEHPDLRPRLMEKGLKISTFLPYHLPEEDIEHAKETNGFVYLQAKPADKTHPKHKKLKDIIRHLKEDEHIENPIYCGVGVRTPEDVAMIKEAGADGVFVGSTVLKLHDKPEEMKETIKDLSERT